MAKRRQRRWEAQQIVLLLARLAHHLLLWAKRWLSREPVTRRRLRGYGLVRLLQEVATVPGLLCWQHGWLVSIQFDPLHPPGARAPARVCRPFSSTCSCALFALKAGS
jgi:hypothetical protein